MIKKGKRIVVVRYSFRSTAKGRMQKVKAYETATIAEVQPATSDDLLKLAEGDRDKDVIAIWTTFKLCLNDEICYNNNIYKIIKVQNWNDFFKGIGIKQDAINN
jgi:hypothetical protein